MGVLLASHLNSVCHDCICLSLSVYTCVNSCIETYIYIYIYIYIYCGILILFWGSILRRVKWVIGSQNREPRHTLVTLVRLPTAWSQIQSTIRSTSCILYSQRRNHLPLHKTLLNTDVQWPAGNTVTNVRHVEILINSSNKLLFEWSNEGEWFG